MEIKNIPIYKNDTSENGANVYTPIAVHLEKTNSEPVQLSMEDI